MMDKLMRRAIQRQLDDLLWERGKFAQHVEVAESEDDRAWWFVRQTLTNAAIGKANELLEADDAAKMRGDRVEVVV